MKILDMDMKGPLKIDIERVITSTKQTRDNCFVSDKAFKDRLEYDLLYFSKISSVKEFVRAKENLDKRFLFDKDVFEDFLDCHLYRICLEILISNNIQYPKLIRRAAKLFANEELAKEILFIAFQKEKGTELPLVEDYESLFPEARENIKTHRIFTRKIDGGFILDLTRKQFYFFTFFLLLLLSPIIFYIIYFHGMSIITYMIGIPLVILFLLILSAPVLGLFLK